MAPPSPYPLRDVGDPQVTRNFRSVFRCPRTSFPPPWRLALMQAVEMRPRFHLYHQARAVIPVPWDATLPPRLGFKQSALTMDGLAARLLAPGTGTSTGFFVG